MFFSPKVARQRRLVALSTSLQPVCCKSKMSRDSLCHTRARQNNKSMSNPVVSSSLRARDRKRPCSLHHPSRSDYNLIETERVSGIDSPKPRESRRPLLSLVFLIGQTTLPVESMYVVSQTSRNLTSHQSRAPTMLICWPAALSPSRQIVEANLEVDAIVDCRDDCGVRAGLPIAALLFAT